MYKKISIEALKAMGVSVIINALLFLVLHAMGIFSDDIIIPDKGPITMVAVVMASILLLIIATIVFMLLIKFIPKYANKIFWAISILVFLLTANGPNSIPGITIPMFIALDVMHLVCGLSIAYFLTKANTN